MTPCPPILNRSTTTRIPLTPQQTTHSLSSSKWTSETFPSAVTMVLRTLMSTHLRHSRSRPTPPPLVLCLLLPLAVRKFPNIIRISNVNNTTITTTTPIPSPTIIVRVTPTTVLPPVTRRRRTTTANSAITLQPWRSPPSHPHTSIPNCRWSPPSLCPVPLWMTPTAETPARSTSALPVLVVSILLNLLSFVVTDVISTAFARAYNLKTHMATHDPNRLKPHVCPHRSCGRSFSRKHDLGRHLISIHRDDSICSSQHSASSKKSIGVEKGPRGWCEGCGKGWVGRDGDCECHDIK